MVLASNGMPCPVIAAVTGHAIAGGLVLALSADLRIASLEGRYRLTEVKVGVPYPQAAIGVVRAELAAPAVRNLQSSTPTFHKPGRGVSEEGRSAREGLYHAYVGQRQRPAEGSARLRVRLAHKEVTDG